MVYFLSIGALNALVNVGVWIIHGLCCFLAVRIYARVSSFELSRNGKTSCTDASDVSPEGWIFGWKFGRWRSLTWWAAILLVVMVILIPTELLLEAGIDESNMCRPVVINSTGVCASTHHGGSAVEKVSAMIQVQNFEWSDKTWDFVPVGAAKKPKAGEVRLAAKRRSRNASFLVNNCKVKTGACSKCGNMTMGKGEVVFRKIVTDWSEIPRNVGTRKRGDLTNDGVAMTVFIFWDAGSIRDPRRTKFNGTQIYVRGIEMVLKENEKQIALNEKQPFPLDPERTRTYDIECSTDGLSAENLANAVSIYRTVTLEQPGIEHTEIKENISYLKPLDRTDVAKAAYAYKAQRWADNCHGHVDVYTTCGKFKLFYVLPFAIMSAGIIFAAILVHVLLRDVKTVVPHSAESWRRKAHRLAQDMSYSQGDISINMSENTYDPTLFDGASEKPSGNSVSAASGSNVHTSRRFDESNL